MSASKEYKAVRNYILNELHLTKEDIIKSIEPLLEKLVKQCMNNNQSWCRMAHRQRVAPHNSNSRMLSSCYIYP